MTALKWTGESRDMIEGLLAPYGGPAYLHGKDFHGEFFSPTTDFALGWFKDWERPLLYNHGLDGALKTEVVGRIKVMPTDKGLWMQAQLDKANQYYDAIAELVDTPLQDGKSALGLSSGSVGHLVQTDHKSGEIKAWPLIEGSLTPTPANPDATAYAMKSADAIAHLAVIGTEAPDAVKSEASDDAASATYTVAGLISLLGDETDEAQAARLRAAIDAVNQFVAAEVAEIGSPEDQAETAAQEAAMGAYMSLKSALTPQALHDAAVASGAACKSGEIEHEPAPLLAIAGKHAETPAIDLDAFKAQLSEVAIKHAKELLGS